MKEDFKHQLQRQYTILLLSFTAITVVLFFSGLLCIRAVLRNEQFKKNAAQWQREIAQWQNAAGQFFRSIEALPPTDILNIDGLERRMYLIDKTHLGNAKIHILDSGFNLAAGNTKKYQLSLFHSLLKSGVNGTRTIVFSFNTRTITAVAKKIADYYIVLFFDFSVMENKLAQKSHFGVLFDKRDTIISTNMASFKDELKYHPERKAYVIDTVKYTVKVFEINGTYRYAAFERADTLFNAAVIIGISIVCITGLLIILGKQMLNKLVLQNTKDLQMLLNAIEKITDPSQLIPIKSNNEFGIIAGKINRLLANIQELHAKNEYLLFLSMEREIKVLEASFNPHFIYNTLEAIKYAMFIDKHTAVNIIQLFSEILRYSLNADTSVQFDEDIYYIESLLELHKIRLEDTFDYALDIPDSMRSLQIPKLFLQPLIENSLKYGFKEKSHLTVTIRCYMEEDFYVFEVSDSGAQLAEKELQHIQKLLTEKENQTGHIGLYMTARLVKLYFGGHSYITVHSSIKGTVFRIYAQKSRYGSEPFVQEAAAISEQRGG